MTLAERFDQFYSEYCEFDRIANRRSQWRDVHAFLLLEEIMPKSEHVGDLISASEHDEFFLDIDVDVLHEAATDEQIQELVRCGMVFSASLNCLKMNA